LRDSGPEHSYGDEPMTSPARDAEVVRPRGRPRRVEATEAILAATLELFAERGFAATTMDGIAERARVGKPTIYRRWSSKEDLIVDALVRFTAELELPAGVGDVRAVLLEHVRTVARFFSDPLARRLLPGLLGELEGNPRFATAYSERVVAPLRRPLVDLLASARDNGQLRGDTDPEQIADLLVGPAFLRLVFPFGLPEVDPSYPETLLDAIWHGIAPPPTS
jgi:AcrR family transcriptional regulator